LSLPWYVLLLLVAAAGLHTAWNFILKQIQEKNIAVWWALVFSAAVCLPALVYFIKRDGPDAIFSAWPFILASAVLEAIYYTLLAAAYRVGDFSLVYPIARGAAPALLAAWSVLFLDERLSRSGLAGIILIVAGLLIIGGSGLIGRQKRSPESGPPDKALRRLLIASVAIALLVALCTSLYSVVDGAAVKQHSPIPYIILVFTATSIIMTPLMLVRYGAPALLGEWKVRWRQLALIGLLSLAAYLLVLSAYRLSQVSYAGAVRELSVVFAAFAGWRLLGEKLGKVRLGGALIVFVGILFIAVL
jgi:drug/metabolite transporter (DMT)-like permease